MAEWLGKGLQNLVQRFESASDLDRCREQLIKIVRDFFCLAVNYSTDRSLLLPIVVRVVRVR